MTLFWATAETVRAEYADSANAALQDAKRFRRGTVKKRDPTEKENTIPDTAGSPLGAGESGADTGSTNQYVVVASTPLQFHAAGSSVWQEKQLRRRTTLAALDRSGKYKMLMTTIRNRYRISCEGKVMRLFFSLTKPDHFSGQHTLLENAKRARTAYIVRHENVGIDPDVFARLNVVTTRMASEDFFSERLGGHLQSAPDCTGT